MPLRLTAAAVIALALLVSACQRDAAPRYDVSVTFNDTYTAEGGAEIDSLLHEYDAKAEILLLEIFPPIARTTLSSRRADLCEDILGRVLDRPDVATLDCQPAADD